MLPTYKVHGVQFDEKSFASEAELAYLGPGEGVDLCQVLENSKTQVGHSKAHWQTLHVLK